MMTRDEAVTVVKDCFPAPYKFHDGGEDYLVVYQGDYDDPEALGVSVDLFRDGAGDAASLRGRCSAIRAAYEEVFRAAFGEVLAQIAWDRKLKIATDIANSLELRYQASAKSELLT